MESTDVQLYNQYILYVYILGLRESGTWSFFGACSWVRWNSKRCHRPKNFWSNFVSSTRWVESVESSHDGIFQEFMRIHRFHGQELPIIVAEDRSSKRHLLGTCDFWDSKNFNEQSSWVLSIYDHQYIIELSFLLLLLSLSIFIVVIVDYYTV